MTALYNRDFSFKLGVTPIEIHAPMIPVKDDENAVTTLRVVFDIEKTSSSDPNTAEVEIYNLSETHRSMLQQYAGQPSTLFPLMIEAGYVGTKEMIFLGDIESAESYKEGTTWITKILSADGGSKHASMRFNKSFAPGTTVVAMLTEVIAAFGIGPGNAIQMLAASPRGFTVFQKGVVVTGRISNILDKYVGSAGFQWSIQNNQLQVLQPRMANLEPAVFLDSTTGLIGSPEVGEKGRITFRSLLQGSIRPGRRVVLASTTAKGTYVVERARYIGDTWGGDWYADGEADPEEMI